MTEITFEVRGTAVPQGSKNSRAWKDKTTGQLRSCTYDQKAKGLQAWRTAIAQEARNAVCPKPCINGIPCKPQLEICADQLLKGALVVDIEFVFKPSKTRLKLLEKEYGKGLKLYPHTQRPDKDKLERAVFDACTKVIWVDDSQIFDGRVQKHYGNIPGCRITVRTC